MKIPLKKEIVGMERFYEGGSKHPSYDRDYNQALGWNRAVDALVAENKSTTLDLSWLLSQILDALPMHKNWLNPQLESAIVYHVAEWKASIREQMTPKVRAMSLLQEVTIANFTDNVAKAIEEIKKL